MNTYILNIETSTKACSVALFNNENLIFLKEHASEDYSHSETLSTYISNAIKESGISFIDLPASIPALIFGHKIFLQLSYFFLRCFYFFVLLGCHRH